MNQHKQLQSLDWDQIKVYYVHGGTQSFSCLKLEREKWPELINRKEVAFHKDNVKPPNFFFEPMEIGELGQISVCLDMCRSHLIGKKKVVRR